jgi:geranylgeranylglycerol-phosphate geranylgeranyltransferase
MLLSPLPLLMQSTKFYMSPVYGASALISVAILACVCYTLLKSHDTRTIGKARKTTLASMAIALLGMLLTALL